MRVASSAIYAPLEHICACSFGEDARYPSELPQLSIQPVYQSGEQLQYSLTKLCPFRLGNKELPPTWGYGRPIPNIFPAYAPRYCAIYFLHQSSNFRSILRSLNLLDWFASLGYTFNNLLNPTTWIELPYHYALCLFLFAWVAGSILRIAVAKSRNIETALADHG